MESLTDWAALTKDTTTLVVAIVAKNLLSLIVAWGAVEWLIAPKLKLLLLGDLTPAQKVYRAAIIRETIRTLAVAITIGLTFIPLAQPPLCTDAVVEGCQTWLERLAVGVVLGIFLVLGHTLIKRRLRGKGDGPGKPEVTIS